jgi:putative tricarboxylic transport membrane protein
MQDNDNPADRVGVVSTRNVEIVVAALLLAVGALVMWDSARIGAGWVDPDGPRAGYFPFYIGLLLSFASAVTLVQAVLRRPEPGERPFVDRGAIKQVLFVLVPAVIFVGLINYIGIYVASTLYIAGFMLYIGRYGWIRALAVGLGVATTLFLMFEIWFLVPLPKGPLEALFGF